MKVTGPEQKDVRHREKIAMLAAHSIVTKQLYFIKRVKKKKKCVCACKILEKKKSSRQVKTLTQGWH